MIGTTLSHYRIVEQIGAGGMGVVYRAEDTDLQRDVAVKVLAKEVIDDPSRLERFRREAQTVAKLDHPNILNIHELGTHEGAPFIVTELLEGESLRQRTPPSGMGWQKVIEIGASLADGLAAAHSKGIVHRDLKPENIYLTSSGRVKILDFGLAQIKEPVREEAETATLTPAGTVPGTVMGTVGYMSPEQVRGHPADARSDIFALGCVLYEMLTGKIAFARDTTADTQAAILKEEPPPLTSTGVTLPAELERSINRCLEKSPEARFQSASDLAFALRSITTDHAVPRSRTMAVVLPRNRSAVIAVLGAAVALMAVGGVMWFLRPDTVGSPDATSLPRIAVLPFENLGPADDEYFSDGITDEVRGKLGRLAGLEVIARDSSDHYRATTKKPREIADELGVRYLLTAKVRWQKPEDGPSRIRLSSELMKVRPGGPPVALWQESFDADLADVFQVQSDIAARVVSELGVVLGSGERRSLGRHPTDNLEAYELFLQARELTGGRGLTDQRKEDLLQRAVRADPQFAMAWAQLSVVQTDIFWFVGTTREREAAAQRSAHQALAIDPSLPEARYAMAYYYLWVKLDNDKAREQVELGLEVSPNHSPLLLLRARVTRRDPDRWEEALADLQRAAALDPASSGAAYMLGWHLLFMRRYADAEEELNRALSISPGQFSAIRLNAMVRLARGDLEGARAFLRWATASVDQAEFIAYLVMLDNLYWVLDDEWQELLLRLDPEYFGGETADRSLVLAHTYYLRGKRPLVLEWAEQARVVLEQQLDDFPDRSGLNSMMGVALAYLGRREQALEYGRRGLRLFEIRRLGYPGEQLQLARIHILLGQHEEALDLIESLLEVPFYLSPGWLSIDPMFDPLRDHPRFQALLEGHEVGQ